ncbi:MAG: 3-keto-5-aminohexanoate cleavage protein [Betaproteobacteria bacterium]|nr:3-keto-5-aminohexanoate cleavage protein [Betaproteobacteria bacterium]
MITPKVIITVAPTGGMAGKKQNHNLPTQPDEIAESVHRSYNEGASIVAVHARRPDDEATCDPKVYGRINELIRQRCDIIINNSTGGGVNGDMVRTLRPGLEEIMFEERIRGCEAPLCEMVTFDCHTIMAQFNNRHLMMVTDSDQCTDMAGIFQKRGVKPEWECFNLSHLLQDTSRLIQMGFDKPPYWIDFVLNANGFQGGYPYTPKILQMLVDHLPNDSLFCVSAIGTGQLPATTHAILLGGHIRVGLEDNNYYAKGQLATNEQLVARAVRIIRELGAEPATAAEARQMLNLKPVVHTPVRAAA